MPRWCDASPSAGSAGSSSASVDWRLGALRDGLRLRGRSGVGEAALKAALEVERDDERRERATTGATLASTACCATCGGDR